MTWLLAFAGEADWTRIIADVLGEVEVTSADSHTLTFCEQDGGRWGLLLVHYSGEECWAVKKGLEPYWKYGFFNRVEDVSLDI